MEEGRTLGGYIKLTDWNLRGSVARERGRESERGRRGRGEGKRDRREEDRRGR